MPPPPSSKSLKSYHCLCSTLLLTTPYPLPLLPRRSAPSLDRAYILPLPSFPTTPTEPLIEPSPTHNEAAAQPLDASSREGLGFSRGDGERVLPSLVQPALRPQRKAVVVQRADGWERRRVWRCGRCGVGVGYEIEEGEDGRNWKEGKVMYLLEGALVETGEMEMGGGV